MRWDRSGTRSGPRTRAERTCGSLARHEAICRHREPRSSPPHSLSRCPLRPTLLPRQRAADCRAQSWATPAAARANTPRRGGASRRPRRLRGQCKPASKTPVATKVGGPQPRLTGGGDPRRREQRERPPAAPFAQTGEEGARTQRTLERRLVVDFVAPSSAPFRFARRAVFPKHKSPFVSLAAGARHGFVMLFVCSFGGSWGRSIRFPLGADPSPASYCGGLRGAECARGNRPIKTRVRGDKGMAVLRPLQIITYRRIRSPSQNQKPKSKANTNVIYPVALCPGCACFFCITNVASQPQHHADSPT